jgi:putative Ca2+/H+ antiporter (TMEM165/GDT1 family)
VQPGTDTLKDPPVDAPAHLTPIDAGVDAGISQPMHSFALSFLMIIMSEIGDKTFLIAALMAMKHSRLVVFSAAFASLVIMSMLSAILGHAVPTLIPKAWTAFLAGGLFLVFGVKMLKEGLAMEKGNAEVLEEMAEVEAELQEKSRDRSSSLSRKLESGTMRSNTLRRNTSSPALSEEDEDDYESARGTKKGKKGGLLEGIQNLAGLVLSPAWVQTFVMTFLGEWGDRSQIATIAMAAGQDYWYVTIGTIAGHSICTGIAVIGGRMLASKISVRTGEFPLGGIGAQHM